VGHLEEPESETDSEVSQLTTTRKVGRKSNCNRREMTTYREKELGIHTTLEEVLK